MAGEPLDSRGTRSLVLVTRSGAMVKVWPALKLGEPNAIDVRRISIVRVHTCAHIERDLRRRYEILLIIAG